jgi:hypothetical protein
MNSKTIHSLIASLAFAGAAFAQTPAAFDTAFQVRYMSNLNAADSVVNITNTGQQGAALPAGTAATITGSICANIYAFSPDEQMISCCSCPVTPNGLVSLSARRDLISNTLTPAVPTSIVVKIVGSRPTRQGSCTNSAAAIDGDNIVGGLLSWGTTVKAGNATVETAFSSAFLSEGEGRRLRDLCNFIQANGSGFGICRSCTLGGLGGGRQ